MSPIRCDRFTCICTGFSITTEKTILVLPVSKTLRKTLYGFTTGSWIQCFSFLINTSVVSFQNT